MEHVVLQCPQLRPGQPSGLSLAQALGFRPGPPLGGAAVTSDVPLREEAGGSAQAEAGRVIERTKRRLECWRQRTLEYMKRTN